MAATTSARVSGLPARRQVEHARRSGSRRRPRARPPRAGRRVERAEFVRRLQARRRLQASVLWHGRDESRNRREGASATSPPRHGSRLAPPTTFASATLPSSQRHASRRDVRVHQRTVGDEGTHRALPGALHGEAQPIAVAEPLALFFRGARSGFGTGTCASCSSTIVVMPPSGSCDRTVSVKRALPLAAPRSAQPDDRGAPALLQGLAAASTTFAGIGSDGVRVAGAAFRIVPGRCCRLVDRCAANPCSPRSGFPCSCRR